MNIGHNSGIHVNKDTWKDKEKCITRNENIVTSIVRTSDFYRHQLYKATEKSANSWLTWLHSCNQ